MVMCQYNTMADILAAAFGGKKQSTDISKGAKTAEEAVGNINALLNFG